MLCFAVSACFFILGSAPGYEQILDAVSIQRVARIEQANAIVAPTGATADVDALLKRVDDGALLVTERDSPLARALGIQFEAREVEVTQVEDAAYPSVPIFWEKAAKLTPPIPPAGSKVLVKDKWSGAPLMILFAHGKGKVVFLATELQGDSRFPYFLQALLHECGVTPPFRSPRLHAFFDYGYRTGVDLDYFAQRWRRQGVMALHVSAWQFWDRDKDAYLRDLIAACHRQGIVVYAWFEFPHVSDRFYEQHPEWREKTATLADAHLDWRGLINLLDPAAFEAVSRGLRTMLADFDWDGVNLSEMYFESPQGPENQQRFTPMNDQVRAEFHQRSGIDPVELFQSASPHYWKKDAAAWRRFVDYRAELVVRLHTGLFEQVAESRRTKPYLQTIVTFVDNLYADKMREAIGADVRGILPLATRFPFTLVLEDPAMMWSLGPDRYRALGERYHALGISTPLGVDINIVERYQDVFPTKKQTGGEFLRLFHTAAEAFPTVLEYFEASAYPQDMEMVSYALAVGARVASANEVELAQATLVNSTATHVDGQPWPARDAGALLVPTGKHTLEAGVAPSFCLTRLNGELLAAGYDNPRAIAFRYRAETRAIAAFSVAPSKVLVDGVAMTPTINVILPPGQHEVLAIQ